MPYKALLLTTDIQTRQSSFVTSVPGHHCSLSISIAVIHTDTPLEHLQL